MAPQDSIERLHVGLYQESGLDSCAVSWPALDAHQYNLVWGCAYRLYPWIFLFVLFGFCFARLIYLLLVCVRAVSFVHQSVCAVAPRGTLAHLDVRLHSCS